ncbi:alpha/beta hydrolase [Dyadobacter sp. 3J3]|uniref:alpha/beta hydrolase n=1 Tax=Dyadobacter sp. 3J3 TaxID=2606600 RepID=UPI00135BE18B|nr:alpha/beta hydrolase [Dyadobacter sp. 3J3]
MKTEFLKCKVNYRLIANAILFCTLFFGKIQAQNQPVKNVVIVHGAFADGSGWRKVFDILYKKGYNVTVVQNPCSTLQADVDATNLALDKQDGSTILVGHSWAGTVITQAGVHPKVVGLVYVSGFMPDKGENTITLATSLPASPESGLMAPDAKGYSYYDKDKFHAGFAADLSKAEADFMYASQGSFIGASFGTPVTEAAWRDKPSYAVIPTEDKSINPDILRNMAKRAGSVVTEVKGSSHVSFMSHPDVVAGVIMTASMKPVVK